MQAHYSESNDNRITMGKDCLYPGLISQKKKFSSFVYFEIFLNMSLKLFID